MNPCRKLVYFKRMKILATREQYMYLYIYTNRRKFRSQTSDKWTDEKAEVGRVREEKAREEERRSEKRKGQKKEDAMQL